MTLGSLTSEPALLADARERSGFESWFSLGTHFPHLQNAQSLHCMLTPERPWIVSVLQPAQRCTPVSRGNSSNAPSVMTSGDFSSFVKSQQGEELFYAPAGLYQVLRRARLPREVCVSVSFSACPFCQAGHSEQENVLPVGAR